MTISSGYAIILYVWVCLSDKKRHNAKYGNLNIPPEYTVNGMWINKWVNRQKQIYHGKRTGKKLTKSRLVALSLSEWFDNKRRNLWQSGNI